MEVGLKHCTIILGNYGIISLSLSVSEERDVVVIEEVLLEKTNKCQESFFVPSFEGAFSCSVPSYEEVFVVLYLFV